ncbi:MAG: haloacid dehalogenase-like hydrolase [Bacteroidales bacterium]|nr:haloacid dehalogenase-like hydrolase [Bacteroidales bacterium]MCF8389896.1 haloacid dehalogenase-like hydrolase [Bacteroidales bacterium]
MRKLFFSSHLVLGMLVIIGLAACTSQVADNLMKPIAGFSEEVNSQLEKFLIETKDEPGRKIAVFDGDGTVLGQTPHYLADEAMYHYAMEHPEKNPEILQEMIKQSNVSIPYVQNRVKYISGISLQEYRDMGEKIFNEFYSDKIYEPMRELILTLKQNGFEIWIITASPEGMYQQFLSKALDIPITNIVGIKSVIKDGMVTDEIIIPIPQDHGKKWAIESFVQDVPLLVAGNSRGDKEMIEFSRGLKIIVNPDEHIAADQTESISDYAKMNDWLIVKINDVPAENFPSISSTVFGVALNKTNAVKQ